MPSKTLTGLLLAGLLLAGCGAADTMTEVPPHHPAHADAEQAAFQAPPDTLPTAVPLAVVHAEHPAMAHEAHRHDHAEHEEMDHAHHAPDQHHMDHDEHHEHHEHHENDQHHDQAALDAEGERALSHATDAYLTIADRLADDSVEGVAAQAGDLDRAVAALQGSVEGHGEHLRTVRTQAQALAQAADLTAARRAFGQMSPAFAHVVESFGAPEGVEITRFVCGMADAPEGGVWLQRGTEPRNPYFGSRMLRCHRGQAPVPFRSPITDHTDHH